MHSISFIPCTEKNPNYLADQKKDHFTAIKSQPSPVVGLRQLHGAQQVCGWGTKMTGAN